MKRKSVVFVLPLVWNGCCRRVKEEVLYLWRKLGNWKSLCFALYDCAC